MTEERIVVEIDDAQLDMVIAKLKQAITLSTQTLGTPNIAMGTKQFSKDWASFLALNQELLAAEPGLLETFGTADLPGINRELRLILGQIPGVRNLISAYFRLKRVQRSVGLFLAGEGAMGLYLTIIATAILILKTVLDYQRQLRQERLRYEQWIRRERGWTQKEYEAYMGRADTYFRSRPG